MRIEKETQRHVYTILARARAYPCTKNNETERSVTEHSFFERYLEQKRNTMGIPVGDPMGIP